MFGARRNDMGGLPPRRIGIVRARARTGLGNVAYTTRRMVRLNALISARASP